MRAPIKTTVEWVYWATVTVIMSAALGYGAVSGWEILVGRFDHGLLDQLFIDPAVWFFPSSLMLVWALFALSFPELVSSEALLVVPLAVHALLTLALAAWLYRSHRASLQLRATVLVGLLVVGAAPWTLVNLFLF